MLIATQQRQFAHMAGAGEQGIGQCLHVAHRQVEALSGNGVQGMRRVAQDHQIGTHLLLGPYQRQRINVPGAHALQGAQAVAEHPLQLLQKRIIGQPLQAADIGGRTGPDECAAVVGQRQQGHRPIIGEALERLPLMRIAGGDVGDQGVLIVARVLHGNAQLFAQLGTTTVGQHGQVALHLSAVVQGQCVTVGQGLGAGDFRRTAPAHHLSVKRLPQALAEPGVLHHIAQGRYAFVLGAKPRGAEATAVGHMDLTNRFGTLADRRPQAQALIDLPGAVGQR